MLTKNQVLIPFYRVGETISFLYPIKNTLSKRLSEQIGETLRGKRCASWLRKTERAFKEGSNDGIDS